MNYCPLFFKKHPSAILGLAGTCKALLDNYWVFTSIPFVGEGCGSSYDAGLKYAYLSMHILLNAMVGAYVGQFLPYPRKYHALENRAYEERNNQNTRFHELNEEKNSDGNHSPIGLVNR